MSSRTRAGKKSTVGSAVQWLEKQGKTHFGSSAALYKNAVERFDRMRVGGEPGTIAWVLQHLDTLGERLARAENVKGSSIKTYTSRARTGLEAYQSWSANPTGWSPTKSKKKAAGSAATSGKGSSKRRPPPLEHEPEEEPIDKPLTLQEEISEALKALADWPLLQPYLITGITAAMSDAKEVKPTTK